MTQKTAPTCTTRLIELPLTRLHIMESGNGLPLIIVPATISQLENWVDLIQFMAQWFHVYFFELPGHGLSTPYREEFSTRRVAQTVGQLADALQMDRFNLMGFSFGGILAMRAYDLLQRRIDRLILTAPCLTNRAIRMSRFQKQVIRRANGWFRREAVKQRLLRAFHHSKQRPILTDLLQLLAKFENRAQVEGKLATLQISTLEVLTGEIAEIMDFEFLPPAMKFETPCYFTMSIYDPLLDYEITLQELQKNFANIHVTRLYFPFHQPPTPFTFDELNRDFGESIEMIFENSMPYANTRGNALVSANA